MVFSIKANLSWCTEVIKTACSEYLGPKNKISCAMLAADDEYPESLRVMYEEKFLGFWYIEGDHETSADFWKDVATDVTLRFLDVRHNIFERIPMAPEGRFNTLLSNNIFQGYNISNRFWNADTLTFSYDDFARVAAEIRQRAQLQQEAAQGRSVHAPRMRMRTRGTLLSPLSPAAALPAGEFVPVFAAEIQALQARFVRDEAMKNQAAAALNM